MVKFKELLWEESYEYPLYFPAYKCWSCNLSVMFYGLSLEVRQYIDTPQEGYSILVKIFGGAVKQVDKIIPLNLASTKRYAITIASHAFECIARDLAKIDVYSIFD